MVFEAEDLQFPAGQAACAGCLLCSEAPCCTQLYVPFPHRPHPNTWRTGSSEGKLPPTAADSEGPQRARSQDCWPRRAGLSGVPAPGADSPMTTGTQSFQAETV